MSMRRVQTMAFILMPLAPSDVLLRATGFMASTAPTSRRLLPQSSYRKALSSAPSPREKSGSSRRSSAGAVERGHYCCGTSPWSRASRSTTATTTNTWRRGGTKRTIPSCCATGASAVDESPSQHSNANRLHASGSAGRSGRVSVGQQASPAAAVATGTEHWASRRDEVEHPSIDASGSRTQPGDRAELIGSRVDGEQLADARVSAAAVAEGVGSNDSLSPVEGGNDEWESEANGGVPWTEFEDWLLQDTFSRYAIGSGKHVLWRRMVREVPELVGRTPQEARKRWLRLTGRSRGTGGREGGGGTPGSPSVDSFYLQPPVLEQWEEVTEGQNGISGSFRSFRSFRGNVFGQRGVADGTVMTTAPVDASGRRIQDQYVSTQCGVVYELGEEGLPNDLVGKASSKMLKLAPATVLALSAAFYALTVLSHHVQVEVFVI